MRGLEGRVVLVVEDEYLVAVTLERVLRKLGATVLGPVATVDEALQLVDEAFDVALLDVNLGGEMVFPVADRLMERGRPIVFTTGYDLASLPARFADVPFCRKPFDFAHLSQTVDRLLGETER